MDRTVIRSTWHPKIHTRPVLPHRKRHLAEVPLDQRVSKMVQTRQAPDRYVIPRDEDRAWSLMATRTATEAFGIAHHASIAQKSTRDQRIDQVADDPTSALDAAPMSERPITRPPSFPPVSSPPGRPTVIVVADDDRVTREALASMLREAGYEIVVAQDGQEAVEIVGRGGIDLVMLDILMPRLGGIEACRIIKSMVGETFVPVMLVTVKTDTASRVEGLRIGADDYITKPFEVREMIARIESMLRIKRLGDHLVAVRKKLERLSVYDDLTGLFNYRHLHTRLREEFKRAQRYREPLSCVLIDIDGLQQHNERGGRSLGDAIIRGVAESLRRCVREVDVLARYGGEEFLVVLPSTPLAGSVAVATRIRRDVAGSVYTEVDGGARAKVTVSLGVSTYPAQDVDSKEALLRAADAALAQAKKSGGGCVGVNTSETRDRLADSSFHRNANHQTCATSPDEETQP